MRRIALVFAFVVIAAPAAFGEAVRDCASDDHEIAIRACTQLIKKNPRNATYFYNRAISYRATGEINLALSDYNRVIDLNPRHFEALNNRGTIYIGRGDNQRALADFTRATDISPGYAIAHNNRGEALENMDRLQQALAAYTRAIEINPKYARAYANRGDIWRKTGRRDDAIADYRRALSLDANNQLALNGLKTLGAGASAAAPPVARPPAPQPSPTPTTAPAAPSPPPREQATSTGTGFFVSSQGHIVTNYHVVENCTNFAVAHEGSLSQSARLITSDSRNDLALLRVTGLTPSAVPDLRIGVRLGENIYVYGFPLTGMLASSGNFTIGSVSAVAGMGDDTTMVQITAPVQPGNSGGPVLDQHGNVVAVVVSKLNALRVAKLTSDIPQNVNFAIKSLIAMSFLEAANVPASVNSKTTERLDATQIADKARSFTVQIRCN
jgi:serine protease Do